ncbi:MAG: DUF5678 domain-containing protein [Candidatus Diapherotrites archaeon]|nr:DUF5678 domain-containing protein [Candidatus Diapherotrites archaeon]
MDELKLLNDFEKSGFWAGTAQHELQKQYPNEYVAIKDCHVIAHDKSSKNVIDLLEKRSEDLTLVLIQFVPEKGLQILY